MIFVDKLSAGCHHLQIFLIDGFACNLSYLSKNCTTFHRYPIFSTRYSVMCKVYTGYCGTSEIEHGLCACTVDNPLAKARGLSLRTGAQPMLYLPLRRLSLLIRSALFPDIWRLCGSKLVVPSPSVETDMCIMRQLPSLRIRLIL